MLAGLGAAATYAAIAPKLMAATPESLGLQPAEYAVDRWVVPDREWRGLFYCGTEPPAEPYPGDIYMEQETGQCYVCVGKVPCSTLLPGEYQWVQLSASPVVLS